MVIKCDALKILSLRLNTDPFAFLEQILIKKIFFARLLKLSNRKKVCSVEQRE